MPTKLLTGDVWKTITSFVRRSKRADIAVAWCASRVGVLLPLKKGSILVTDLTAEAVEGGRTRPRELLPLVRRNVAVHSLRNLHAKVFVFDNAAIIGSTNVSGSSANKLIEAAVLITGDKKLISDARRFVGELAGDRVGEDELQRLESLWMPQPVHGVQQRSTVPRSPRKMIVREPIWVVPLLAEKWEKDFNRADRVARPLARKRMKSRFNKLSSFAWEEGGFGERLALGQQLLRVVTEGTAVRVSPPGRVTYIKQLTPTARGPRFIVYVEEPKRVNRKSLERYMAQLGVYGKEMQRIAGGRLPRLVKQSSFIKSILQAWPSN